MSGEKRCLQALIPTQDSVPLLAFPWYLHCLLPKVTEATHTLSSPRQQREADRAGGGPLRMAGRFREGMSIFPLEYSQELCGRQWTEGFS